MSRLIAFGCSLTHGYGLKNQDDAWPNILASKCNMDIINHGEPAASNKRILWKILTTDINKDDIVVVKWSYTNRWCVIKDSDNIFNLGPWMKDKDSRLWYKNFYNDTDRIFDAQIIIKYADYYLKEKGIKFYFMHTAPKDLAKLNVDATFLKTSISDISQQYTKAKDYHPGADAHKAYAELVYKETNGLTI